jgi:hypothetical protein
VGFAKICKKLNVPRPYRGYWQLIEAGHKIAIPPLPPARKDDPNRAVISPEYYRSNFHPQDPTILDRISAESLPTNHIEVSPNLRGAHSAIREARDLLENGYTDSYGRMWADRSEDGNSSCLDIRVSKKALPRALRIMDALLEALEARSYKVKIDKGKTACLIDEERVHFYLWETAKRSEREPTEKEKAEPWRFDKWVFTPTGELTFVIDEPWAERKNWRDRKKKQLEEQLNDIVVGMFVAAEKLRLREIERREAEQHRLEAARQRQEIERQRKLEQERSNELETMMALWVRSRNLRSFLEECERSLSASAEAPSDDSQASWFRWARAYADSIDPLKGQLFQTVKRKGEGSH